MVQDFTKIGIQTEQAEASDVLTDAIRTGMPRRTGWAGLRLGIDQLIGRVPMGIDAPSRSLRKAMGGSWELLFLLKHSFGAFVFFLLGTIFCYAGATDIFNWKHFCFGIAGFVLSAICVQAARDAAKRLRSIAKA